MLRPPAGPEDARGISIRSMIPGTGCGMILKLLSPPAWPSGQAASPKTRKTILKGINSGQQYGECPHRYSADIEHPTFGPDRSQNTFLTEKPTGQRHPGKTQGAGEKRPERPGSRAAQPTHTEYILLMHAWR